MPHPLAGDEDRHRAVELELHHLARRRMAVPAKIANEPAGLARAPRAVAVRHACRPLDVLVGAHVVDECDEPVVEDREVEPEDLLRGRIRRTARLHGQPAITPTEARRATARARSRASGRNTSTSPA